MINAKITKQVAQQSSEEKLFKLLESIDWKLWEMYNIMKEHTTSPPTKSKIVKATTKKSAE
jgi:hypothetical protein